MRDINIVIAVDSFKGSASSKEVNSYIKSGILNVYPSDDNIKTMAIADGGEGTVEAVIEGVQGKYETIQVTGPLGDIVNAKYGIIENNIVIIEMAEAAGINLVEKNKLNPFRATTYGVGQMLKSILDKGIRKIYIGLGGSATNDGGAGMLAALGAKFLSDDGKEIGYRPFEISNISKIDLSSFDNRILETEIIVLSDVSNTLCGKNGASHIFGPQKGAKPKDVLLLDSILEKYGKVIDQVTGENFSKKPGSGAAGGLGYALLSVCRAQFTQGIYKVIELIKLEEKIKKADLVITGEGRIDNQSIFGKAPIGIAKIAKKYGIPVIAIVGSSDRDLKEVYNNGVDLVLDIINEPMPLEKAIRDVKPLLEIAGEKALRAFFIGK